MDAVVEDALRAVAEAQAALADAEVRLREAWVQRIRAFREVGWAVVYVHDVHGIPPSQRVVVEDDAGGPVDVDGLMAEAIE